MATKDNQDLLLELYRMNEGYHNSKENMLWISSSAFLGATVAFIAWYPSISEKIESDQKVVLLFALAITALLSLIFAYLQNWYKVRSVYITDSLNKLLRLEVEDSTLTRDKIVSEYTPDFRGSMSLVRKFGLLWKNGKAGLALLIIMVVALVYEMIQVC